jgi:hypothetical protein
VEKRTENDRNNGKRAGKKSRAPAIALVSEPFLASANGTAAEVDAGFNVNIKVYLLEISPPDRFYFIAGPGQPPQASNSKSGEPIAYLPCRTALSTREEGFSLGSVEWIRKRKRIISPERAE